MRDKTRIKPLCNKLADIWETYFPDWRFGQFVMNFICWYGKDPFYLEDDKIEELLDKYVESIVKNSWITKVQQRKVESD